MKYIDLGLPSGTLWANEDFKIPGKCLFVISEIPAHVQLPTEEQAKELIAKCHFEKIAESEHRAVYEVTGPNHNKIRFTTQGWKLPTALYPEDTKYGYYWTCSIKTFERINVEYIPFLCVYDNLSVQNCIKGGLMYQHSVRQVCNNNVVTIF